MTVLRKNWHTLSVVRHWSSLEEPWGLGGAHVYLHPHYVNQAHLRNIFLSIETGPVPDNQLPVCWLGLSNSFPQKYLTLYKKRYQTGRFWKKYLFPAGISKYPNLKTSEWNLSRIQIHRMVLVWMTILSPLARGFKIKRRLSSAYAGWTWKNGAVG